MRADDPSKTELVARLRSAREEWESLLAEVGTGRMELPGVEGDRSVKDIVAHVTWYEREMVPLFRDQSLTGSDLWFLPHSERNQALFQENRNRSLPDVLQESRKVFAELVQAVESLSENDLRDPSQYKGMPDDWVPWQVLEENSFGHYPDHAESIRSWLNMQASQPG